MNTQPKPPRVPRKALAVVCDLAEYGKFDRYGEGDALEPNEMAAIEKVRKHFKLK